MKSQIVMTVTRSFIYICKYSQESKILCIELPFIKVQRDEIGNKSKLQIGMINKKEANRQERYIHRKNKSKRDKIE